MRSFSTLAITAVALLLLAGCTTPATQTSSPTTTSYATSATSTPQSSTTQVASSPNPFPGPSNSANVYGSGSSLVKPIMEAWATQFSQDHSKVSISYSPTGSGSGRKDITNKLVQFAGSDAPMSPAEMAAAPDILTFPESLGPIATAYKVNGVPDGLHFDADLIAKILVGPTNSKGCPTGISYWDDPALQALNPGATLPHAVISVVVRADSSGTTFAFTDFLSRASPVWQCMFGTSANPTPDWTQSSAKITRATGNPGVATALQSPNTPNSFGYIDLAYMPGSSLSMAAVKNQNGEFLKPTPDGAAKAAATATSLPAPDGDWSQVSIANAPGAGVYPISTFTYLLTYKHASDYGSQATADQLAAFKQFAWWVIHDGQQFANPLGYAPLPASVVSIGETALQSMS